MSEVKKEVNLYNKEVIKKLSWDEFHTILNCVRDYSKLSKTDTFLSFSLHWKSKDEVIDICKKSLKHKREDYKERIQEREEEVERLKSYIEEYKKGIEELLEKEKVILAKLDEIPSDLEKE